MHRGVGSLRPVASLPGRYGIGRCSQCAYDFIDWLGRDYHCAHATLKEELYKSFISLILRSCVSPRGTDG